MPVQVVILVEYNIKNVQPGEDVRREIRANNRNADILMIDFHYNIDKEHAFLSILGVLINMLAGNFYEFYEY